MLYKVTPMMTPEEKQPDRQAKDPTAPKEPRKRRKSAVFDADGHEVLITMMCLKCKAMKPLAMFGLRKMADGAIRNQPWCRTCRSGSSSRKRVEHPTTVPETLEASPPADLGAGSEPAALELPLAAEAPSSEGRETGDDLALEPTQGALL